MIALLTLPAKAQEPTLSGKIDQKMHEAQIEFYKRLKQEKKRPVPQNRVDKIRAETIGAAKKEAREMKRAELKEASKNQPKRKRATALSPTQVIAPPSRANPSRTQTPSRSGGKAQSTPTGADVPPIMDPKDIPDEIIFESKPAAQ